MTCQKRVLIGPFYIVHRKHKRQQPSFATLSFETRMDADFAKFKFEKKTLA